jgi:hypothetical protein
MAGAAHLAVLHPAIIFWPYQSEIKDSKLYLVFT